MTRVGIFRCFFLFFLFSVIAFFLRRHGDSAPGRRGLPSWADRKHRTTPILNTNPSSEKKRNLVTTTTTTKTLSHSPKKSFQSSTGNSFFLFVWLVFFS